ncbi:MAG: TIGR03905 family TSCPD domain-containing protein [Prevotella sp.]|nr:TIGR03905 family TSCPD domain-containing protein [Prevotella sp.]
MAQHLTYQTQGTCSKLIDITVDDEGRIEDVQFFGGCNGNLKGICQLIHGQKASEVKNRLNGILCGNKATSCPDQLARALTEMGF